NQLRVSVALDVEHQADRFAAPGTALVADAADTLDALVLDQLTDDLRQAVPGLLERYFGNDDLGAAPFLVNIGPRPQSDLSPSRAVTVDNALPAADDST